MSIDGLPFLWGAGTSAYQVEGGNLRNDWHLWERLSGRCREPANSACEHAIRYESDIALLRDAGLDCYRFSVEWSRIEPRPGQFSAPWIAHYEAMLRACARQGLRAILTLHHFTNPIWVAESGGWLAERTASAFGRYAGVVAEALGSLADLVITINEPNIVALLGYELGWHPPGVQDSAARARATQVLIEGHRCAVAAVRAAAPQRPVGLALAMADWQAPPEAGEQLHAHRFMREDVFIEATAGDDFLGVNTYTRHRLGPEGWLGNEPGVELTAAGYEFWPEAVEATLRRAAALTGVPLILTETGIATDDDRRRMAFIDRAVEAVRRAGASGVDVRGFLYWSALDNFEWQHGYSQRYGLIGVDRGTQRRTVRPSAWHLGRIASSDRALTRSGSSTDAGELTLPVRP